MEFALQSAILAISAGTIWWIVPQFPDGDALYVAKATVAFCLFRLLNPILVAGPLFNMFNTDYDKEQRNTARRKFCNHANKFMMHVVLQAWGLRVLYNEPWFKGWFGIHDDMWTGWDVREMPIVGGDFRDYYLVETAFFLGSMIMQFIEARSHDHVAMLAHHYAAATLLALSYVFRCHRIGMLVVVGRELTDIIIHSARGLALLQYKTLSELILVVLTLLWIVTRCVYHPFVLCVSAFYSPTYQVIFPMWVVFNFLLFALVPLDYYYLYLALSAIVKRIKNPNLKNIDPDAPEKKTN